MAATFQADFVSFNSKPNPPVPTNAQTNISTTKATASNPENYKFDQQRLQKLDSVEKQELFVFQWLSTLEKELRKGDKVIYKIIKNDKKKYIYVLLVILFEQLN